MQRSVAVLAGLASVLAGGLVSLVPGGAAAALPQSGTVLPTAAQTTVVLPTAAQTTVAQTTVAQTTVAQTALAPTATVQAGSFHPVDSTRVLDTRTHGGLASAGISRFAVAGHGPIPFGAAAVAVNITVLTPARAGSLSVFPGDTGWNGAASVSFIAGQTKQSMLIAVLGSNGSLAIRNNTGASIQLIADVAGYYTGGTPSAPGTFKAIGFQRVFDTRATGSRPVPAGSVTTVPVAGKGAIPASGVAGVVANLTVISPARSGSVSTYASGTAWDGSASVSFAAARSEQDVLSISLGSDGALVIRNNTAVPLQVVLDVLGYVLAGGAVDYGSYQPVAPTYRALDERNASQPPVQPVSTVAVLPAGVASTVPGPVPPWGLAATVARVSILSPARAGSISVFRADRGWNGAASISFPAGVSVQQQLTTPLGPDQQLAVRNNTGAPLTVVIDVLGYYLGEPNPLHRVSSTQFEPPTGRLMDVSCASPTFCMTIEQYGKIEIWNGTAWSAPVQVPQASYFGSVSCVSATFCVVAGWADHNSHIELFGFDGTNWSEFASMAYQKRQFPRVSCPSTSFCMATGDGSYRTYDGTSWSAEQPFGSQYLLSLSCPSASFCVAVDRPGQIYTYDGTSWTGPASIAGMTSPQSASCTSASFCVAVGSGGTAASYDGTSWTVTSGLDHGYQLVSVSCASSTNCRALDIIGSMISFNGSSWSGPASSLGLQSAVISCAAAGTCAALDRGSYEKAVTFDGTSWSTPQRIEVQPLGATAVSCTSASFCMAADSAGYVVSYDGTNWGTPVLINGGHSWLNDISCATASSCIAVDDHGNAYHFDGSSWSSPAAVEPGQRLQAVSCASPSFCVAVGFDGKAATFDGSSWTTPVTVTASTLTSVSCPSSTLCLAADGQGMVAVFNGTNWSADRPTGTTYLDQISCASTTFCLATGYGQAARWDNGTWSRVEIVTGRHFSRLSCPSAQLCEAAVPSDNNLPGGIVGWDGSGWTMPLDLPFGKALSCPTSSFCMALGWVNAYPFST